MYRILRPILRRSSIRNTILPGIALWGATLDLTSLTRRSISSISILDKWQFSCLSLVRLIYGSSKDII